ncbi:hypothetical protein Tco_0849883 [Tanacetum coccineum]
MPVCTTGVYLDNQHGFASAMAVLFSVGELIPGTHDIAFVGTGHIAFGLLHHDSIHWLTDSSSYFFSDSRAYVDWFMKSL